FLDFLIGRSPGERQQEYRTGLDGLNTEAQKRFHKAFAEVDESEASALLAPLREAWTYEPPRDPVANFLLMAKQDIRTGTVNSREYNASNAARGGRRFGAAGLYWYPLD
ncbi:MAG: gluconate 2-dehydrogenase subunit 3 family protein, partial [Acidobacteriaceae bacterium]|nr:gluconate 2-dehydrogenase subunit 3 family protein [Acidobacteriaceae bacterium]